MCIRDRFRTAFLVILTYAAVYSAFELITENDLTKINGSMYTYFAVSYTHLKELNQKIAHNYLMYSDWYK